MKRYRFAAAMAFALLILAAAPVFAGNVNGHFQGADGANVKNIDFTASGDKGNGNGNIVFAGPVDLPSDEDHPGKGHVDNFTLHADVDCVNISGNHAVLSGIVKQSSVDSYVGQRLLLAVEDNGSAPGRFTWGTYNITPISWTPADAELFSDAGWAFSWYASDAERADDTPVLNKRDTKVNCNTLSLASFDWVPANGSISVH